MKSSLIINYLDEILPNAVCELNYSKDYELLICVMLSANTTDKRVNIVTKELFDKYNTLEKLANADIDDLKRIIKSIGSYNKKSSNIKEISQRILSDQQGKVPNDRKYLESLPGVGRKTTNVVLAILFDEPFIAVDTHVSRVSKRLRIASVNDNPIEIEKKLNKLFPKNKLNRLSHQLVLFGRYYCKAIKPLCENCKLKEICNNKN